MVIGSKLDWPDQEFVQVVESGSRSKDNKEHNCPSKETSTTLSIVNDTFHGTEINDQMMADEPDGILQQGNERNSLVVTIVLVNSESRLNTKLEEKSSAVQCVLPGTKQRHCYL